MDAEDAGSGQSSPPAELATDQEAMKNRVFPPLEDELETLYDESFTWTIDDWRALPERVHSQVETIGDFDWSVLLFPEGNRSEHVSLYLETGPRGKSKAKAEANQDQSSAGQADDEEEDWAVCARFGLVMWNPDEPSIFHASHAHHRFQPDESDWGFTKFYDLRKLFSKHANSQSALIENNKVCITAFVRIVKDPTGVLWHNFIKYDSKKETGYVGLKNQGATCYLNSLLQSLYFTKAFRRIVYQIPTENERPDTVPSALQREFYLLSTSDQPVGTSLLTKSFGWDSGDAFTQHDVQELNRVLMDKLEQHMKGTAVDGALNDLFVAQMKSYIKCVNVDFESSRIEDYWDIQLNVKGLKNLEESFQNYIEVEMLEGENQYQATGYGLQDAKKGVVFKSFPPVLQIQLQRYEYDFNRDLMVKINDRYEFPLSIDLSPYLEKGSDMSEPWIYDLHGVLVHSGELNAGHYYALLKPTKDGKWYKFDDDRVTPATLKEVLEDNYGQDPLAPGANPGPMTRAGINRFNYKRHSSAYMLVYLRRSRLDQVLPPGDDSIPAHIPEKLQQEALEEQRRRKEREEQQYFLNVKVMSNRQFQHFQGFDLGEWETKYGDNAVAAQDKSRPDSFRLRKDTTVRDFVNYLASLYKINPSSICLWTMVSRQNKTLRLDSPINSDSDVDLEGLRHKGINRIPDLRIWMEDRYGEDTLTGGPNGMADTPVPDASLMGSDEKTISKSLVFLKYFDPVKQVITGVTSHVIDDDQMVGELGAKIAKFMNWPQGTEVQLLEEVKPDMVDILSPKSTFAEAEISDGDILCFEKVLSPEEEKTIKGYKTAQEFYDFMHYRIPITFKKREVGHHNGNGNNNGALDITVNGQDDSKSFDLWLSQKDTYDQMANKVGEYLGVDPTHLQFFTTSISGYQRTPIKNSGSTIYQILSSPYVQQYSNVVLYEVLEMSLAELENKKNVTVSWLTDGLSQEHKFDILVAKSATMRDVLSVLREKAKIPTEAADSIKIWTVVNCRIHKLLNESSPVSSIEDKAQVYATASPRDEHEFVTADEPQDDKRIIFVVHFQKDPSKTHGIPFTFLIKEGEKFADTKVRLQKTLGVFDKVFEQIRFAVVRLDTYSPPTYIDDDFELFSGLNDDECLGLDHIDKTTRRGYGQSAIFIKN